MMLMLLLLPAGLMLGLGLVMGLGNVMDRKTPQSKRHLLLDQQKQLA